MLSEATDLFDQIIRGVSCCRFDCSSRTQEKGPHALSPRGGWKEQGCVTHHLENWVLCKLQRKLNNCGECNQPSFHELSFIDFFFFPFSFFLLTDA